MATSAADVISALLEAADAAERTRVARVFKGADSETRFLGVPMRQVFGVAKRFTNLDLRNVETLLDDPHYEGRMAGVSILDFNARDKKLPPEERKAIYDLYVRRHDRINNWDLVDRAAPHVVGEYLVDNDRSVLDRLATSADPHRRRTALVATHAFIKRGETVYTFRIAALLAADPDDYVQKAIASWVREAGKRDEAALVQFIRQNSDRLPRPTLTNATKLLPKNVRAKLRNAST